jgi:carbon storage regulator
MLVLSRRSGEAVCIASNIKVVVLDVRGGRVRLGVSAPPGVPIHRSENLPETTVVPEESPKDAPSVESEAPKAVDGVSEGAEFGSATGKRRVRRSLRADE